MPLQTQLSRAGTLLSAFTLLAVTAPTLAAPTTTNVALNKNVMVSSFYTASTNGSKAVDGNLGTYWRTKPRSSTIYETIQVDLGVSESISRIVFQWNSSYATNYWVEVSTNNTSWTQVFTTSTENGGTDAIDFAATTARYVRMTSRAWNNSKDRIRLNEMEVYRDDGTVPPPPVAGSWSVVASPNGNTTTNTLSSVAAVASNDVWAVGNSDGYSLAERWNGTAWSVVPTPNPDLDAFGARNLLNGVSAVSSSDVWAVGIKGGRSGFESALTIHWDGASWVEVAAPAVSGGGASFYGVSALSSTDVWAVGSYFNAGTNYTRQPFAARWNGSNWSVVATPALDGGELFAVKALSATDAWAVGTAYDPAGSKMIALRWNGTSWSSVSLPSGLSSNVGAALRGISAVSANDIWAVGSVAGSNVTLRYNGTKWTTVTAPNDLRVTGMRNSLYGVSAVSTNDVWAVGVASYTYQGLSDGGGRTYSFTSILHWNGSAWSFVDSPDPNANNNKLLGVARVNANDVWAVGEVGQTNTMIQRYTQP